jgi:uncharacterized protein YebE (UPF0316 family)
MDWLDSLPDWGLGIAIFLIRIVDVSICTVRTIAVVQGRTRLSVMLGFIEVLIWTTAVAKVFQRAPEQPLVLLCYAAGFATGNAVGILIEKRLALGAVILRIVTHTSSAEMEAALRERVVRLISFDGREGTRPVTLLYIICPRKDAPGLIELAQQHDRELFFAVDPLRESSLMFPQQTPGSNEWPQAKRSR